MKKLFLRILEWYRVNFVPYVTVCASTGNVYISRALWHEIVSRVPSDRRSELRVFFEKYPVLQYVDMGVSPGRRWSYRFFVNTDLSSIRTPEGEEPFSTCIQFSSYGHIGFHSEQPTTIEILTEYGIADSEFINNYFFHDIRLRVSIDHVNDEPCYVITTRTIGKPVYVPFSDRSV